MCNFVPHRPICKWCRCRCRCSRAERCFQRLIYWIFVDAFFSRVFISLSARRRNDRLLLEMKVTYCDITTNYYFAQTDVIQIRNKGCFNQISELINSRVFHPLLLVSVAAAAGLSLALNLDIDSPSDWKCVLSPSIHSKMSIVQVARFIWNSHWNFMLTRKASGRINHSRGYTSIHRQCRRVNFAWKVCWILHLLGSRNRRCVEGPAATCA